MKRGDIYRYTNINATGSIQSGNRPVIIVQNDVGNKFSPTTIVCPLSCRCDKQLPTHCLIRKSGGLKYDSIALCEQITTVNKSDLTEYIGTVTNPSTLKWLSKCLKISLGIEE